MREFFGILFKFVTQAAKILLAHGFSTSKKKRFGEGIVVTDLSPHICIEYRTDEIKRYGIYWKAA